MLFGTYEITPIEFYARELNTCIETTVDNYTGEVHVYDGNLYSENKSGGGDWYDQRNLRKSFYL